MGLGNLFCVSGSPDRMLLVWLGRFGGESPCDAYLCTCNLCSGRRRLSFAIDPTESVLVRRTSTMWRRIGWTRRAAVGAFGLVCTLGVRDFAYLFVGEDRFDPSRHVSCGMDGASSIAVVATGGYLRWAHLACVIFAFQI